MEVMDVRLRGKAWPDWAKNLLDTTGPKISNPLMWIFWYRMTKLGSRISSWLNQDCWFEPEWKYYSYAFPRAVKKCFQRSFCQKVFEEPGVCFHWKLMGHKNLPLGVIVTMWFTSMAYLYDYFNLTTSKGQMTGLILPLFRNGTLLQLFVKREGKKLLCHVL